MDKQLRTDSIQECQLYSRLNQVWESFITVWLADDVNNENEIQSTIDHVKIFNESDECIDYVSSLNTTKRVLFVISGINNEKMISFIAEISQIHSIYIFRHNGVLIKD